MSQPTKGKKQPAKAGRAQSDKNAGGASGDKKGAETLEKKSTSASTPESPKMQTSGISATSKAQPSSAVASKTPIMKSSETKATQKSKAEPEKAAQPAKPDSQTKHPSEEKQKDPGGAKSPSRPPVVGETKQPSPGKVASDKTEKLTQLTAKEEPKAKPDQKLLAKEATLAAVGTAGAEKAIGLPAGSAETKDNKLAATTPVADSKPAEKSDLDTALDDLIDTLGGPEENEPPAPAYTGPGISEPVSSVYIEELGKRESTIPPKYRKLLESKGDDKEIPPPAAVGESQPSMTDDDLADALSSDFTCSAALSVGEKTDLSKEKSAEEGDLLQAQTTNLVSSSAPPKEKKAKLEEVAISDSALDALVDTLGMPEPEPEVDLSSIKEVEEPKAKERREKKAGEDDDTIPPEYRLKPTLDKDGKPILPKPEEKPKPLSESDLVDEFSRDFACPTAPTEVAKPSKPDEVSKKAEAVKPPKIPEGKTAASPKVPSEQSLSPSGVSAKTTATETKESSTEEVVSAATIQPAQSSVPAAISPSARVTDEALEALSGSLGKIEPVPEEKKPAVDKVKEKTKKEKREKLGEDEETIPPDYRLTEAKDKDGKPLLPKPEEKPKPLSESELLDALSEGFSCSSAPTSKASPQESASITKPAVVPTEEVVLSVSAPAVHSSAPPPASIPGSKELDAAADLLADSLGQREPDPDENKPLVDKIKEKAKSEHREKLGERDDTIPPEYRHILDSDGKDKPRSTDGEKPKEQKKPADDSAAIDALSGDFDNCEKPPVLHKPSPKEEKTKEVAASKPVRKDEKKTKTPKKAKEQSSSGKSEKQKKS